MNIKLLTPTQEAGTQSLEDFLEEMSKGAKTLEWDALLVFDRAATNTLLAQEYIDRIAIDDKQFPKLPDDRVDAGNGIEHVMLGLVLDKPRLSFENASIQESKGKMLMRLVGGKYLEVIETFHDGEPVRSISRLSVLNAAVGDFLQMDIRLEAVAGSVSESGKVLLDLSKGVNHLFSGAGTELERIELGVYFKEIFDQWKKENGALTQFELSELVNDDASPVQPGVFGIRTHAAPGATVLGSEAYGNGAVVVFIAMRGSDNGNYPHDDASMLYMLPAAVEPYTANIVLGQKFLADTIITLGLDQLEWLRGKFVSKRLGDGLYKLVASQANDVRFQLGFEQSRGNGGADWWEAKLSLEWVDINIFAKDSEWTFEGGMLKANWRSLPLISRGWGSVVGGGHLPPVTLYPEVHVSVNVQASYRFVIVDGEGGSERVKLEIENFNATDEVSIKGLGSHPAILEMGEILLARVKEQVRPFVRTKMEELRGMSLVIDPLRLNNLLFRSADVVAPRDVALPTDLTLLGNLAPKRTTLVVSPTEVIVASGQTFDFKAESATGSVIWEVQNLPGESGDTGEFKDPSKGRYTAPSDDALREEGQRRVIVTATDGDRVSKALVSVVQSQVSVNPWVTSLAVGKSHKLSAGTPDGAALTWDEPELGTLVPDDDPLNPLGYKYTAPPRLPQWNEGDPLYQMGMRLVPITVRPTAGGPEATIDILVIGPKNANYWMEPEAKADGSVALPFYRLDRGGKKIDVPEPVEWTVLKGSGEVDQATRVYTPKAGADEQYAIVSAFYDNGEDSDTHDYVILPLPFITSHRYADLLSPAIKEV
ncbi:hypothetical protein ACIPZG_23785 [Pseudomonas sp. NPDC089395]|uniref:hypothetical protein n=1 Tax=Pseudomonas sp. NPDC089395 TaxID=3364460 RepID=UPI003806A76F